MSHRILLSVCAFVAIVANAQAGTPRALYQCKISGDPHVRTFGSGCTKGRHRCVHHYSGIGRSIAVESPAFTLQYDAKSCNKRRHRFGVDDNGNALDGIVVSSDGTHMMSGPTCVEDVHLALRLNPQCPNSITHVIEYDRHSGILRMNGEQVCGRDRVQEGPFNGEDLGTIVLRKKGRNYEIYLNYRNQPVKFRVGRSWLSVDVLYDPFAFSSRDPLDNYMAAASGLCGYIGATDLYGRDGSVRTCDNFEFYKRWLWKNPITFRDDNKLSSTWHVRPEDADFIAFNADKVISTQAEQCNELPSGFPTVRPTTIRPTTANPTPSPNSKLTRRLLETQEEEESEQIVMSSEMQMEITMKEVMDNAEEIGLSCGEPEEFRRSAVACDQSLIAADGLSDFEMKERGEALRECLVDYCSIGDLPIAMANSDAFNELVLAEREADAADNQPWLNPVYLATASGALCTALVAVAALLVQRRRLNSKHSLALANVQKFPQDMNL